MLCPSCRQEARAENQESGNPTLLLTSPFPSFPTVKQYYYQRLFPSWPALPAPGLFEVLFRVTLSWTSEDGGLGCGCRVAGSETWLAWSCGWVLLTGFVMVVVGFPPQLSIGPVCLDH